MDFTSFKGSTNIALLFQSSCAWRYNARVFRSRHPKNAFSRDEADMEALRENNAGLYIVQARMDTVTFTNTLLFNRFDSPESFGVPVFSSLIGIDRCCRNFQHGFRLGRIYLTA